MCMTSRYQYCTGLVTASGKMSMVLFMLISVGCFWKCSAETVIPLSEWNAGVVANFGGPADMKDPQEASFGLLDGSCGYGKQDRSTWPFWKVAAISPENRIVKQNRNPLEGCGACLQIACGDDSEGTSCIGQGLVVQVVDTCQDCAPDTMVIPYSLYIQSIGEQGSGRTPMVYRQVECEPPAGGNIRVDVSEFREAAGGFIKLALEWVAGSGAIRSVELRESVYGGEDVIEVPTYGWQPMTNAYGAIWELSGIPNVPIDMRIVGDDDQVLIAREAIKIPAPATFSTSVQFKTAGNSNSIQPPSVEPETPGIVAVPEDAFETSRKYDCNDTVIDVLNILPNASAMLQLVEASGVDTTLIKSVDKAITLIVPTNEAWASIPPELKLDVNADTFLREMRLYLFYDGIISLPNPSDLLPEDKARGGVTIPVESVGGYTLDVVSNGEETYFVDIYPETKNATIVDAISVCDSLVLIVDAVPIVPVIPE